MSWNPRSLALILAALGSLAGCATLIPEKAPECAACPVCPPPKPEAPAVPAAEPMVLANWAELPGWSDDDAGQAWGALLASCSRLKQPEWRPVCDAIQALGKRPSASAARALLEERLQPWRIQNADGTKEGLITGYYEPLIRGSRTRTSRYATPVLGVPDDLLTIDLGSLYPELKHLRLRGRLVGNRVVPYDSRASIDEKGEAGTLPARVLLWAEDPIDFFFLQVQGSGQVQLADGGRIRIAYADQNGHPYLSIGRWLVAKGELKAEQAGMDGIRSWARANPQRLSEMLDANPSYVFFKEAPNNGEGPHGALGIPLTAQRSIAVDPRTVPLGAPVFLATTYPRTETPLRRLVLAQDTGGAIKGRVRADFFWGFGAEPGAKAGNMRQKGALWVLWPRDHRPPTAASAG
jgi:membrane-bound lytic murein transglycosylase A